MIHLLFQIVHAEIAHIHSIKVEIVAVAAGPEFSSLGHFLLGQLHANFLFFAFAQDSEVHSRAFRITADEL